MKYFVVHRSIYAVNIWRQSLIKMWRTPSAGAAAVSSIHNLVREDLAEVCGKQVASKEGGLLRRRVVLTCPLYGGLHSALQRWIQTRQRLLGFPKVASSAHWKIPVLSPAAGPNPFAGHWVPGWCQQRTRALPLPGRCRCPPLCIPPSCAPHQGAGRCWPIARPLFVSCAPTEEFI